MCSSDLSRVLLLLALVASALWFVVRPLRRRVTDEQVALYLEEHEPALQARVLSAVEASQAGCSWESSALVRRLIEEAIEHCVRHDAVRRVEEAPLRRYALTLAGVAIVAALFVGLVIYRELDLKHLRAAIMEGGSQTAVVMLLVATSALLGTYLTEVQAPQALAKAVGDFTSNKWVVLALLITRSIVSRIQEAAALAHAVAEGDLTVRVQQRSGRDETVTLLDALSRMQQQLLSVVSNVRHNAESVATAIAVTNIEARSRGDFTVCSASIDRRTGSPCTSWIPSRCR